jgi:hypothetical protein
MGGSCRENWINRERAIDTKDWWGKALLDPFQIKIKKDNEKNKSSLLISWPPFNS